MNKLKKGIRKFEEKDLSECIRIAKRVWDKKTFNDVNHDLSYPIKRFVYCIGKKIVGFCGLYITSPSNNFIGIDWFAIDPKYQNRGIGTKLLKQCEGQAKEWKGLFVWADKKKNVINFYLKNGFKTTKRKNKETILMLKNL